MFFGVPAAGEKSEKKVTSNFLRLFRLFRYRGGPWERVCSLLLKEGVLLLSYMLSLSLSPPWRKKRIKRKKGVDVKLLTPEQVSQQLAVSRWTVLRMIMTVHYLPCACDRVGGKRSGECEKSA